MYVKEFAQTRIIDAHQLVDSNGSFKVYDDLAVEFNLIPNNRSFVEYIKLISATPKQWDLNSVFCSDKNTVTENYIEKLRLNGKQLNQVIVFFYPN